MTRKHVIGDLQPAVLWERRAFLLALATAGGWSLGCRPITEPASPAPANDYTGFITVRLSPSAFGRVATQSDDLRVLARAAGASGLSKILDDYPALTTRRSVSSVAADRIADFESRAAKGGFPALQSLTLYWRLDAREVRDPERLVSLLNEAAGVEVATRDVNASDPGVNAANDPQASGQGYLDAAPVGIDAKWAWNTTFGTGMDVRFVDLEQGWLLTTGSGNQSQHEDLPPAKLSAGVPREMNPAQCPASRHHGTAIVGILSGTDNTTGIVGISHGLDWMDVASHYEGGVSGQVANAILKVLPNLVPGDVLLLSVQKGNLPTETEISGLDLNAIRIAVGNGIVVVEAAGNGDIDLNGVPQLNQDSGAIIVGAAKSSLTTSGTGHDRWVMTPADFTLPGPLPPFLPDCGYGTVPPFMPGSNYGTRVNCYAWGENVVTAGYGWLGGTTATSSYTNRFGGTSAAAAIVAGAAVVLQGIHKAIKGVALTPLQMRSALSTFGTPQGSGQTGAIGVMPDLQQAARALGLTAAIPSSPTDLRIIP